MLAALLFAFGIWGAESAVTRSALDCKDANSLYDFMTCFDRHIQNNRIVDQDEYASSAQTTAELAEWRRLSSEMLKATSNRSCASIQVGVALSSKVFLGPVAFRSAQNGGRKDYCLLFETRLGGTGHFARGFGMFATVLDPEGSKNVHISAAHPTTDGKVQFQAAYVMENTKGIKSITVPGAQRRTVIDGVSSCQPNYGPSDAAHNTNLAFHQSLLATKDWQFASERGCDPEKCGFVQFHGMARSSCGNDTVFISPGFSSARFYTNRLAAQRLTELVQAAAKLKWNVRNPTTSNCNLVARSNPFGRVLNGVTEGQECKTKASITSGKTYVFVHIESKMVAIQPEVFDVWPAVLEKAFSIA